MDTFRNRWPDFLIPAGLIACLMVIFVPLPAGMMDVLLAANITIAVIILLSTIYVRTPLELSLFPSLLLATTLARLALNIGTTRLILTRGAIDHEQAAGGMIASFSNFVTGDSLAVGVVIFAIIVVIQFVVITKGATRISEVSARFSLDGMPGRQMAIDAELNAGSIDHIEAQRLRAEVGEQADFYGAMDGASKFVRGDAIAAVLITVINILAGLAIGVSQNMSIGQAAETFTKLTIGDGLVSQLPALLISLAAGLLVTRSNSRTDLSRKTIEQIFSRPIVMVVAAAFLGLLVLTDLPKIPLLLIAMACLVSAYLIKNQKPSAEDIAVKPQPKPVETTIDKLLSNDLVEIELGIDLIRLADSRQGGTLLASINNVRQQFAAEMGVILPKIRIRDNLKLGRKEYRLLLQGNSVERGELEPDHLLAIDTGNANRPLNGAVVIGLAPESIAQPGYWIQAGGREEAVAAGYQINTTVEVLANQLQQMSVHYADELLTRDATAQLIGELSKTSPALVSDLIPNAFTMGELQSVLRSLLSEGVSIRPLHLIMETLGNINSKNLFDRVEKVRTRLARHISSGLAGDANLPITVFTISEELQNRIACAWDREQDEIRLDLPRTIVERLALAMEDASRRMISAGLRPIALVDQSIRPVIAKLRTGEARFMFVLGDQEIQGAKVDVYGEITSEQLTSLDRQAA
jgi:flagellar biosynthesis protein FlhA